MNDDLKTLKNIVRESFFIIPDYQRGYSWSNEQLNDFFEDLMVMPENEQHYTGMLTLEQISEKDWDKEEFDNYKAFKREWKGYYVVDGQQRLTTCIILINEIFNFIKEITKDSKETFIGNDRAIEVQEMFLYKSQNDNHNITAYKLISNDKDTNNYFIKNIIGNKKDDSIPESLYTNNLENAKKFFHDRMIEIYDKKNPNNKNYDVTGIDGINLLYDKLVNGLVFNIYKITPDNSNVYVAFESMNNRGKKLSNLELLKNRLIYLCSLWETKKNNDVSKEKQEKQDEIKEKNRICAQNARNTINETWKNIYKYLGKVNKKLEDDEYLRTHWIIYFGYSRSKMDDNTITYDDYLLRKYFSVKRLLRCEEQNIKVLENSLNEEDDDAGETLRKEIDKKLDIDDIIKYTESLDQFIYSWFNIKVPQYVLNELLLKKEKDRSKEENEKIQINILLTKINRLENGHFNPLIAVVLQDKNIDNMKKIEFLTTLERYIFLFYKLDSNSANINDSFDFNLAHKLYKKDKNWRIDKIIEHFKKLNFIDKNGYIDTSKGILARFQKLFEKKGYYSWGNALKYFLLEYDNSKKAYEDHVQKVDPEILFNKRDTIEHIYPETPEKVEEWVEAFKAFDLSQKHILMHSLGNLLILIAPENSKEQNKPYKVKVKERYKTGSQSEIEVSDLYPNKWDAQTILDRGKKLLQFMQERWDFHFKDECDIVKMLGLDFLFEPEELKKLSNDYTFDFENDDESENNNTQTKRIKRESFPEFYEAGKKVNFKNENFLNLKNLTAKKTGEKENSTDIYISAAKALLSGKEYKLAIRNEAVEYYLSRIFDEYDDNIKVNALKTLEKHIEYRAKYGSVAKLQEIYNKYKKILEQM